MTPSDSPLFCFGSLMDEDVLRLVTARDPASLVIERAIARDHAQREVLGESFPILLPVRGERAEGKLVHGLDAHALDRVLFFEGGEYELAPLVVEVAERAIAAHHFRDTGFYRTTGRPWDFARWRACDLGPFLARAERYMGLYGTMSPAEADAYWTAFGGE